MALKKTVFLAALLLLLAGQAAAEGNLTIVATPAQVESMDVLLRDLKDEDVTVKVVAPAALEQAKKDEFVLMVITAALSDPLYNGTDLLSEADRARIGKEGGKKLVLLRDVWQNGQEIIVFAGHGDDEARQLRMDTKERWWEIVGGWFGIFTGGMKGY